MSDNVIELVQEAQKRGKFSLADAIKGRAYPEKSVEVYLDAGSAFELADITEELKRLDPEDAQYAELSEKVLELEAKILESKITFDMRGVGQEVVEKITAEANEKHGEDAEAWAKFYSCALVASNIVQVSDKDGNVDDSKFTADEVALLRGAMPIDAWQTLVETMQKLTLAASYFDAVTDAGFLQKS